MGKIKKEIIDGTLSDKDDYILKTHAFSLARIKNGSNLIIGKEHKTYMVTDQHFNWFQKLMWKWCFGIKVEDYNKE